MTHKETNIVETYMKDIVRLHGVPKEIVSDKYPKFTFVGNIVGNIVVIFVKDMGSLQISNINITSLQISKLNIARWGFLKVLLLDFL
jgi:hypothetical protein